MNLVKGFDSQHVGRIRGSGGHLSIVRRNRSDMALDIVKDYLAVISFKDMMRPPGGGTRGGPNGDTVFVDWENSGQHLNGDELRWAPSSFPQ